MRIFSTLGIALLVLQLAVAPPVKPNKQSNTDNDKNEIDHDDDSDGIHAGLEYNRYLKEVVQALESDPEFRKKLEKADEADIKSGKIAHELEFVNHNVRTKLDELKRQELDRLRHIALREYRTENGLDPEHIKIAQHVDFVNQQTFEIGDLKQLILKTTQDLAELDRRRRDEFRQYEMEKKFEQEQKMKGNTGMTDEEKKKYQQELHDLEEKHKKHEPLHHPGSKQQLEEVWEKQDHMENQDFDPRTFFYLHDLDGNGVWDQDEVKALFLKELDKMYSEGSPEDDVRERAEEMERMREHIFKEADLDKDGLLSYSEFLAQTKKPEFERDEGWQGLDEQQIYTQQEYEEFERRRQEEIQKLIAKGMLPPEAAHYPPGQPGQQFPPHQANPHQEFVDPMGARHPNEIPQQQQYQGQPGHGQVPSQQQYQGQVPPQQQYQGQVPPQQQYQGQAPPQQQYRGQVPPQQQQQQQQQQQYQGQVPPQQQQQQYQAQGVNQQNNINSAPVVNQVPNTVNSNVINHEQPSPVQQQQQPNIVQNNQNVVPNVVNTHS